MGSFNILCLNRTVSILLGLVSGDWRREDNINKQKVFVIEPVVESLLQVRHQNQSRYILTLLSTRLLLVKKNILHTGDTDSLDVCI